MLDNFLSLILVIFRFFLYFFVFVQRETVLLYLIFQYLAYCDDLFFVLTLLSFFLFNFLLRLIRWLFWVLQRGWSIWFGIYFDLNIIFRLNTLIRCLNDILHLAGIKKIAVERSRLTKSIRKFFLSRLTPNTVAWSAIGIRKWTIFYGLSCLAGRILAFLFFKLNTAGNLSIADKILSKEVCSE